MSVEACKKVLAMLDQMNITYQIERHAAVFTIEDMENLQMEHIDKVAKNLFVRDDKKRNYYLLVVQKDKSVNLKELQHQIGSRRLSFASEDDLGRYLGLRKGEVSPFGILNDTNNAVTIIIDKDLSSCDFIGVHPNDNTATVWISVSGLEKVLETLNHEVKYISL